MTTSTSSRSRHLPALAMLLALGAVFAWLLARNAGLHPAVFADEWYYSKMARLMPLEEAFVPSYLYLWIFRASNACGDGFLDCVRLGNELFFVGAAPFIYLITRQVAGRALSFTVALLSLLAPFNLFTAMFMPEATFYFGFSVLSWVVLTHATWSWTRQGLAAGLVLGLMSLIKVHALFLLPALFLFFLGAGWLQGKGRAMPGALGGALLASLMTLSIKFGLGYLLAGDAALSLFGSFYSGTAQSHVNHDVLAVLRPIFINGRGHLMALAILMVLPLAILTQALLSRATREATPDILKRLQLFTILMLGAAAGLATVYTASIAGVGPAEGLRLHQRYYSFVFPLLLILVAATIARQTDAPHSARPGPAAVCTAVLVAIVVVLGLIKLPSYVLNMTDGPEIASLRLDLVTGKLIVALDLLILFLWARGNRLAGPLFLFVAVPFMTAMGIHQTATVLRHLEPSSEADRAGKFAHHYVPKHEHKQITVATTYLHQLMRIQFHIDDKDVAILELAKDAPIEPYQLPVRNKWLLVVGPHALPDGVKPEVTTAEYALVRLRNDVRSVGKADFSEPLDKTLLATAEGLSLVEPWGRWSDTKTVVLHFKRPLPKQAHVILKAHAFDINTTLPFTMRIGNQERQFRLSALEQEVALQFETDGSQTSLSIEVPRPISPKELGQPNDVRTLGIALAEIEIVEPSR